MANAFQKEGPVITPENPEKPVQSNRELWEHRLNESHSVKLVIFLASVTILLLLGLVNPLTHGEGAVDTIHVVLYILSMALSLVIIYWQACCEKTKNNKSLAITITAVLLHLGLIVFIYYKEASFPAAWDVDKIALPYIFAPMIVTSLLGPRMGTFSVLSVGLLGLFYIAPDPETKSQYLATSLTAGMLTVYLTRDIRSRAQLLKAGFMVGLVVLVMSGLFGQFNIEADTRIPALGFKIGLTFGVSFVLSILIGGILPVIESVCKIITPISWLELTDMNHKLLKRLQLEAPGTFHHCIVVAQLAEAAAESIGANGNYCRVVSYYHDIGKVKNPLYFIENLIDGETSPHDELTPTMSARIIIGHVTDGVELAKEHKLNKYIVDAIQQHHGKSLAYFFYHKALEYRKAVQERVALGLAKIDDVPEVVESNFTYPGPIPQSKEVAIVSLADIVESATRSLQKPTYEEMVEMINNVIKNRIVEGHLDDSGLTLSDIKKIRDSFINTLKSMRHARISYPKDKEDEKEEKEEKEVKETPEASENVKENKDTPKKPDNDASEKPSGPKPEEKTDSPSTTANDAPSGNL